MQLKYTECEKHGRQFSHEGKCNKCWLDEKGFAFTTFNKLTPEQKDQFKKQKFQCLICGKETTGFCDHKINV